MTPSGTWVRSNDASSPGDRPATFTTIPIFLNNRLVKAFSGRLSSTSQRIRQRPEAASAICNGGTERKPCATTSRGCRRSAVFGGTATLYQTGPRNAKTWDTCEGRRRTVDAANLIGPGALPPVLVLNDRHFLMEEAVHLEQPVVVCRDARGLVDVVASSLAPVDWVARRPVQEDRVHPGTLGQSVETLDAYNAPGRHRKLEHEAPADPDTHDRSIHDHRFPEGNAYREPEKRNAACLEQHLRDSSPKPAVHLSHSRRSE